jgi:hypothetical protein
MKRLAFGIAAIAAALVVLPCDLAQAAGPFSAFAGNFAGAGTITVKDGSRERIRCRSGNAESGNALKLGLRCASDSYRFELTSDITSNGGNISGNWSETSRNVFGTLSGRVSGNSIQANAQSASFNAMISIQSHGNRLSVVIQSPGSEISEVTISMARGR